MKQSTSLHTAAPAPAPATAATAAAADAADAAADAAAAIIDTTITPRTCATAESLMMACPRVQRQYVMRGVEGKLEKRMHPELQAPGSTVAFL